MCGYDTDVAGLQLYHLDLARRSAREGQHLVIETGQPQGVVGGLKDGEFLWRVGECKDMDAVQ